jgi:hypothetical protein
VSASFFELLGAPAMGRAFAPAEDAPGGESVVVLSHAYWQRRFGGDTAVLGRAIRIGPSQATVIGVMPTGFGPAQTLTSFAPLAEPDRPAGPSGTLGGRGRARARRHRPSRPRRVHAFADRLALTYPAQAGGLGGDVASLTDAIVGNVRPALWILLGGVVVCSSRANIGNLLLPRPLPGAARWPCAAPWARAPPGSSASS